MSKLRVIYLVSTLQSSGPTNQLYNIIRNLDRDQFEPYLITLSPEPAESRWADYEELGIQMESLNLSRLRGLFLATPSFRKLVQQIQPNLIHTQGIRADSISAALSVDVPRICTVRNIPQHDYLMTYGKFMGSKMARSHGETLRKLDLCIGVSKAVCDNLRRNFSLSNVETIRNGVDTNAYFPVNQSEKKEVRRTLGLPVDGSLWITSGHLSERKDPLFLINVWKDFLRKDLDNHLVFVGDGPLKSECMELIKDTHNIHLLGRVSAVGDCLRASDYFVSASKAEGLPNSVLEALACGLPGLLSDIGPHKEIFELSSSIGQLYPLGSAQGFYKFLEKVKNTSWSAQSKSAEALTHTILSAESMSNNYQSIYLKLAAESNLKLKISNKCNL